ncbi:DUF2871 domain-containing protein [Microtetraspora sp. NBRC 16547]|uniref:DUF2871 domain-containing protein n=1 Tax=Microtetraspora sp. NBRC 16547 TaxID=3030993 RepID=UPI0024A44696|nr:DUF2871 domain-containing protein [Microtetraspora sp. NBRC 16547]GLX02549.1 hypothetical protein Misp02_66350 [Microtetraspora sp. NBRC 16547]
MKKLYYAALVYMALGLAGGLYYRDLTKANDFTGQTQLGVVHTHLLVLGMFFFLIMILFERAFALSKSRLFGWFFWIYNAGLVMTVTIMTVHGTLTVLGKTSGAALAGIAGLGHILLTVALILFFVCLRGRLFPKSAEDAADRPAVADGSAVA